MIGLLYHFLSLERFLHPERAVCNKKYIWMPFMWHFGLFYEFLKENNDDTNQYSMRSNTGGLEHQFQ